jgi:hypothetical protein
LEVGVSWTQDGFFSTSVDQDVTETAQPAINTAVLWPVRRDAPADLEVGIGWNQDGSFSTSLDEEVPIKTHGWPTKPKVPLPKVSRPTHPNNGAIMFAEGADGEIDQASEGIYSSLETPSSLSSQQLTYYSPIESGSVATPTLSPTGLLSTTITAPTWLVTSPYGDTPSSSGVRSAGRSSPNLWLLSICVLAGLIPLLQV